MDKHEKPKKYVLVKYEDSDPMFVLLRETWEVYFKAAEQTNGRQSYVLAESDNQQELCRFRELTKES